VSLTDAAAAVGAYARRGEARRAFDGCSMYAVASNLPQPSLQTTHP
jgi:hypothetical protein